MAGDRTIPRLWRDAVAKNTGTAYLVEDAEGWQETSWAEAAERVELLANGLLARGVRKGDAFAILARTSLEWALFDFALAHVGAVGAAIYANSSPRDARYIVEHSEAVGILCEDETQRSKVEEAREALPGLRHVLTYADLPALEDEGRAYRDAHPEALNEAVAAIDEEDLFTYIYTSGTTGPPKGCMIRHRNYYVMVAVVDQMPRYIDPGDVLLLFLPLAHNFGRLAHLSGPFVGITIAFLPDPLDVARAMPEVRPMIMPSVPRVYEKVHTAVSSAFDEATGVRRKLVDWALEVGREASALRAQGAPLPRGLAFRHRLADRLVFAKVRERLGGRLRTPISGGAPLAKEIAEFFDALGIRILEGYGLTECTTAATTNRIDRYRFGTVGPALPGFELRVAEDGELLVRSETVFAGYFKEPEATAEVLGEDGWLRTGDIATIDDDGFVTITDRKKDLIVTAGGKNIAPQNLENDLKTSKYVSQAIVIGDRRPYPAALITLDPVEIAKWAAEQGLDGDVAALASHPKVVELVAGIVDDVNSERSRYEQLKRFRILARDFELDHGEVTPTLKLKRPVVLEHFAAEVEALYDTEPVAVRAERSGLTSAVQPVRVVYEKWDGRPHWEFDALRLGEDEYGVWVGVRRGTHQARPGVAIAAAEDHVLLVADGGEHCATFHSDPEHASIEVYVDVTCAHRWHDERITMIDLDLDVIRHWDGSVAIDDEDEFEEHRVLLGYPEDVVESALAVTWSVRSQLERGSAPFDGETSERWLRALRSGLPAIQPSDPVSD